MVVANESGAVGWIFGVQTTSGGGGKSNTSAGRASNFDKAGTRGGPVGCEGAAGPVSEFISSG